jgi:sialic acid synthase SpsE
MKLDPKKVRKDLEPKKILPLKKLIERDIKANHSGEKITLEQAVQILAQFKKNGAELIRFGNTLFIVVNPNDEDIVFHTMNADPPQTYLYNGLQFFSELQSRGKKQAVTYFSSPKVTEYLKKIKLPSQTIAQSDDPSMGTTMLVTPLVGGA